MAVGGNISDYSPREAFNQKQMKRNKLQINPKNVLINKKQEELARIRNEDSFTLLPYKEGHILSNQSTKVA